MSASDGGGTVKLSRSPKELAVTKPAAFEPEGDTVQFTITGGADSEDFNIDGSGNLVSKWRRLW